MDHRHRLRYNQGLALNGGSRSSRGADVRDVRDQLVRGLGGGGEETCRMDLAFGIGYENRELLFCREGKCHAFPQLIYSFLYLHVFFQLFFVSFSDIIRQSKSSCGQELSSIELCGNFFTETYEYLYQAILGPIIQDGVHVSSQDHRLRRHGDQRETFDSSPIYASEYVGYGKYHISSSSSSSFCFLFVFVLRCPLNGKKTLTRNLSPPVMILFFLWGFTYGLVDVLNSHFQEALKISSARAAGLSSAYFGAYLICPPTFAGWLLRRFGYRLTFMTGK